MIREFKAQIFCRENNLSKREIDTADPIWIDRIDAFFRRTSLLPSDGDPTEYAAAFESVYPQPRHRRQYIDDAISKGTPCFGHKVLGSLIAARKVDCVFTTNFDPLVEDSALSASMILPVSDRVRPTVAAIDSAERAMRCLNESDWPLVAKLHGDYQSIAIKNTGPELEEQDARMRHVLVEAGKRFGMIFVGYSGRDASILEALATILDNPSPFPNGLYWVTSSVSRLLPAVTEFLNRAQLAGVDVAIIECATFDELAADTIKTIDLPVMLFDRVMLGRPTPRLVPVQLPTAEARPFPVLRYSALLIEKMPCSARRVTLAKPTTSPAVRELLKEKNRRATVAANGRELAVFGRDQDILSALAPLGPTVAGEIKLDPVADSWALGLLYDALVRSLARHRPLIPMYKRAGHSVVVAAPRNGEDPERTRRNEQVLTTLRDAYGCALSGTIPRLGFPFQEGVFLKLDQFDGRWWCGFEPYTFVHIPRPSFSQKSNSDESDTADLGPMAARVDRGGDPAGDWRRERWAQRYNRNWAAIINAWAQLLTTTGGGARRAFGLEDGSGIDAVFEISPVTGWSRPGHHHAYFDRSK
ncbi:SIR2 family protein [Methylobacterium sp. WL9]|uniref:SIR2 family protein n=1 Tax=Methylobacterium sp. WL9 TaxID=2603898 RepID=UPI0011CC1F55|nr:SIR2 family protein [Methylobacterium sp. WL9]TXN21734.1 SIR2 family protein [Methylobacterium sp. WL9]